MIDEVDGNNVDDIDAPGGNGIVGDFDVDTVDETGAPVGVCIATASTTAFGVDIGIGTVDVDAFVDTGGDITVIFILPKCL